MPKRQKRFRSEKAILKAIDVMEARRTMALEKAETLEASILGLSKIYLNEDDRTQEADYRRKMAGMARRSAQRAANKKVELGKALSQFRTMLLPLSGNEDTSITL